MIVLGAGINCTITHYLLFPSNFSAAVYDEVEIVVRFGGRNRMTCD